ncbi:MAG: beta-ketoacyl-ACP synthase II [Actinomycetia bacterium]|nr:beta-ketoacyl-ACP synthase II [Actinomycetes bacterium]MCP5035860.1 beta-ketoacyl-ACP synthase II [Actinomycetes bacterium]
MGLLSPVGNEVTTAWDALVEGRSGIGPITQFDVEGFPVAFGGEVTGFDPGAEFGRYRAKHLDRFTQLALSAAGQAVTQAGIGCDGGIELDPFRVGVIVGSGAGGLATMEKQLGVLARRGPTKVSPFVTPMMCANMAAGEIAIEFGAMGFTTCPVTACAASANAIGDGFEAIRSGRVDTVIAGGADASIVPLCIAGFGAMKALSTYDGDPRQASRPFEVDRDGFVISEGAAIVVLEERSQAEQRGATIFGEVLGYGTSCDAHHPTAPHPDGAGARASMIGALAQAGVSPHEIDYLNAHGTSTAFNDATEAAAVAAVIGGGVAVSSTKSVTGHLLGAAGAFEAIATIQAIRSGCVPPTINLDQLDPACDFDSIDHVANVAVERPVRLAMSNSFGFGGHNVSLLFGSD